MHPMPTAVQPTLTDGFRNRVPNVEASPHAAAVMTQMAAMSMAALRPCEDAAAFVSPSVRADLPESTAAIAADATPPITSAAVVAQRRAVSARDTRAPTA